MALDADKMAEMMETAFVELWKNQKQDDLTHVGAEDRRLLFRGIAHGLLRYLKQQQGDVAESITFKDSPQPLEIAKFFLKITPDP